MKKRILSVILCLCMVVGMLPAITPTARAATSIANLQEKFPSGKYWNHYVNQVHESGNNLYNSGDNYFADFVSDHPCNYHYEYGGNFVGCYDCNYYYGLQCFGFARRMAFLYYGSNVSSWWSETDKGLDSLKAGDVIDYNWYNYQGSDGKWYTNYGHTVWVTGVNGDGVTYADCNGESKGNPAKNCQIMWGRQCNKNDFNKSNHYTVWHAPYAATGGGSSTPSQPTYDAPTLNHGNFYARILQPRSGCYVGNKNANVELAADNQYDPKQIWQFIYQTDKRLYKIVNMYDGGVLDATNWGDYNGANIALGADNGATAQRWWLCGNASYIGYPYQFYFVPSYLPGQELAMDVYAGGNIQPPGTNIQLYENWYRREGNFTDSQDFRIIEVNYSKPAKPSTPTFKSISANPARTIISWNSVPLVNNYDSRQYILEIYNTTTNEYVLRNQRVAGTSYTTTLPVGSYRAEIQAVNTKYPDYKSGWNMQGNFTVYPFCNISVTATPTDGGTVWNDGLYCEGETTTIQAKPNPGWRFAGWTRNGQPVTDWVDDGSAIAGYSLTVTGDETFEALFVQETAPTYTISVQATEGGNVSGGGTYEQGASVTVTAETHEGYDFKGWQENGTIVQTEASYTFTADKARTLTAVFEKKPAPAYTIAVDASPSEGGTVSGAGTYTEGNSVEVTATAADGYTFKHWAEGIAAVSTNANYTFTADKNRTLTAVFEQNPDPTETTYTITVSADPTIGGSVSGGGEYKENQQVLLIAAPANGYRFVEWRKGGGKISEDANYTVTISNNETYTAVFEKIQTPPPAPVNYTVNVTTPGGGTVSGGGSYKAGTSITVTATPANGYHFVEWQKGGTKVSDSANYNITVGENQTLTAVFEKNEVQSKTFAVSLSATLGGTVSGSGGYTEGAAVTVTASPTSGYRFTAWMENGEIISESASYQFVISADRTLRAVFEVDNPSQATRYDVEVSASPSEGGTVSNGGSFADGTEITVTATPKEGYRFLHWMADGSIVSSKTDYKFTVHESLALTAIFEQENTDPTGKCIVSVTSNPANGGTTSGGGSYSNGASVTVAATADSGYRFVRWTEGGNQVSTSASYTFTVTADRTLVAEFTTTGGSTSNPGTNPGSIPTNYPSYPTVQRLPVKTDKVSNNGATTVETTASPSASISNGVAKATIASAIANEIIQQATENGSTNVIISPKISGSVAKAEVSIPAVTVGQIGSQTNASLTIVTPVAEVSIPNSGLGSLSSPGGTVTVTTQRTGNAVELFVTAGGRAMNYAPSGLTLTVPAYTTSGTVAVLVNADGTREVVRKSVADNSSVMIPLNGSAKVEIVDNGKYFYDVPSTSWAADAVAFASAHELLNGTGANQFSPDLPMSRGMLATVLHNLESNPYQPITSVFADVDYSEWYTEGVAWAAAHGIVGGYGNGQFGPSDNITREQLAVALWRYTGSPAATDRELHFADADKVSDWALEALRWATESGVMNGKGNSVLDPGGQATRAEVAQMLKNYLKKLG